MLCGLVAHSMIYSGAFDSIIDIDLEDDEEFMELGDHGKDWF